jgi:hypothetical protein
MAPPGTVGDRPCVPVRLQIGGKYIDTFGIVDSGADGSLFNMQFAIALGLNPAPTPDRVGSGVGGGLDVWDFDIFMSAYGKRFAARVGFSPAWSPTVGLLGRADFFSAFHVGFDEPTHQVLLQARP